MICFFERLKYLDGDFINLKKVLLKDKAYGPDNQIESKEIHDRALALLFKAAKNWENDGSKVTGSAFLQDADEVIAEFNEMNEREC